MKDSFPGRFQGGGEPEQVGPFTTCVLDVGVEGVFTTPKRLKRRKIRDPSEHAR